MEFKYKLEMLPWLIGMLVVTSCVHEAGHAWIAWRSGDRSDYIATRKNPFSFRHVSWLFTLLVPIVMLLSVGFMLGGARPVQVRMAVGPGRMALVALAGPIGNFMVAAMALVGLAGAVHLGWVDPWISGFGTPTPYFYGLYAVAFSVFLGLLNLIPVPPLDGSRVVAAAMPESWRDFYYRTLTIPGIILLLVVFLGMAFLYPEELGAVTMKVIGRLDLWCRAIQEWLEA
ncbi:MAG: site-2 protease family protein [Planctomycetota bacterium]